MAKRRLTLRQLVAGLRKKWPEWYIRGVWENGLRWYQWNAEHDETRHWVGVQHANRFVAARMLDAAIAAAENKRD